MSEFFRKSIKRSNFAPCGPSYDPVNRCGFKLESPVVGYGNNRVVEDFSCVISDWLILIITSDFSLSNQSKMLFEIFHLCCLKDTQMGCVLVTCLRLTNCRIIWARMNHFEMHLVVSSQKSRLQSTQDGKLKYLTKKKAKWQLKCYKF